MDRRRIGAASETKRRGRARALTANAAIALLATALTGEAALRVYDWARPSPIFYKSSYDRFRPLPHARHYSFELNSMGLKDVEFRRRKGGAYRIVALGDSFAFGVVPYGFGFLELMEERLVAGGHNVEILNFGIPGIGPWQYLDVLVGEALDFAPDGILLCFYVGNDILNAGNPPRRKAHEYSHLASFLHFLTVRGAVVPEPVLSLHRKSPREYADDAPTIHRESFLNIERKRSYVYRVGNRRFERDWRLALEALVRVRRICRKRKIPLLVVLVPSEIQVDPSLQAEVRATIAGDAQIEWDFAQPNRVLSAALAEAGIARLDLHDAFARAAKTRRLYKPRDTHWNLAGNRLAARVIGDALAAAGVGRAAAATAP